MKIIKYILKLYWIGICAIYVHIKTGISLIREYLPKSEEDEFNDMFKNEEDRTKYNIMVHGMISKHIKESVIELNGKLYKITI